MFQVRRNGIKECCLEMERLYRQIAAYREKMAEMEQNTPQYSSKIQHQLHQIQERLLREEILFYRLAAALDQILDSYEESEAQAVSILEEESRPVFTEILQINQFQWLEETGIRFI